MRIKAITINIIRKTQVRASPSPVFNEHVPRVSAMLPVHHQLLNFNPYITEFLASKLDLNVKILNGNASPCRCPKKLMTASVFTCTALSSGCLIHFDGVWQWQWKQLLLKYLHLTKRDNWWKAFLLECGRCSTFKQPDVPIFAKAAWVSSYVLWAPTLGLHSSNLVHSFWLIVSEKGHFKMISSLILSHPGLQNLWQILYEKEF